MPEEIKKENEEIEEKEEVETDLNEDYIQKIKELKGNTVPKEDYEKLKEEHKKLIDAYVDGTEYDGDDLPKEEKADIKEIGMQLFNLDKHKSNLEFAKLSLAHRNAVLEQKGYDEYVPHGDKIVATDEDYEAADRLADTLQHCIDYADGDSEAFTNELQRIMIDTAPMARGKYKRR